MLCAGNSVRSEMNTHINISRSLIHEPKQARYACNWFSSSLAYITANRVPPSQLLKINRHLEFIFSAYRVASYWTPPTWIYYCRVPRSPPFTNALDVTGYPAEFYGCLIEPQSVSAWWKETAQARVFMLSPSCCWMTLILNQAMANAYYP